MGRYSSGLGRGWSGTVGPGPQSESLDGEREREREDVNSVILPQEPGAPSSACGRSRP